MNGSSGLADEAEIPKLPWAQAQIVVDRPPESVYAFLADPSRERAWMLEHDHDIMVTDPPGHVVLEWVLGDVILGFEAFVEDSENGRSLVRARVARPIHGLWRLAPPLFRARLRREARGTLRRLAAAIEATAPPIAVHVPR